MDDSVLLFYKYAKQQIILYESKNHNSFYIFDHYLQFYCDVRLLFPKTFYRM